MYQFGFIGMGNMGSAMLKGCLSVFPASTLAFSRKDAVKGKALSLETGAVWIFLFPDKIECNIGKWV